MSELSPIGAYFHDRREGLRWGRVVSEPVPGCFLCQYESEEYFNLVPVAECVEWHFYMSRERCIAVFDLLERAIAFAIEAKEAREIKSKGLQHA